jgi:quercetin dioxygenase-like cupin family protein
MRRAFAVAILVCGFAALAVLAQDTSDKAVVVHSATAKFGPVPGTPDCMTAAPQHGDPAAGAFVLQLKVDSSCVIPWHWHSINETLTGVSGLFVVSEKGGKPQTLGVGDYAYMPAKHVHQAKCGGAKPCVVFLHGDGPFDLHYVDKDGNEIPPDKALADVNKPADKPGAKPPAKPAAKP